LLYVFVFFKNFEFLFHFVVVYMSLLYAHGPLCSKACFEEIFCKGKRWWIQLQLWEKKSLDDNRKLKL
jgi:hypothetical protein